MKHILNFCLILIISAKLFSQNVKTISINFTDLARVNSSLLIADKPTLSQMENLVICAWSWEGNNGQVRMMINFDLNVIPKDAQILDAKLSLYACAGNSFNGHFYNNGSNEFYIQRILEPWKSNIATWNNQPKTTIQNQILIPASKNNMENYENIDITNLIKDIFYSQDKCYGLEFSIVDTTPYRIMEFASQYNKAENLRPKLLVTYKIKESDKKAKQEKNNSKNNQSTESELTLLVFDQNMNLITKEYNIDIQKLNEITSNLTIGTYLFEIIDKNLNINTFKVVK